VTYFYRFLRSDDNGTLKSELRNPVTFYIESECSIKADFSWNTPVLNMKTQGETPQLLFGASSINESVEVLKFWDCYGRVLSRFNVNNLPSVVMHTDQQINSKFSKYLLAPLNVNKLIIPDTEVEVLSYKGWVSKEHAKNIKKDMLANITKSDYEKLIQAQKN